MFFTMGFVVAGIFQRNELTGFLGHWGSAGELKAEVLQNDWYKRKMVLKKDAGEEHQLFVAREFDLATHPFFSCIPAL